MSTERKRIHPKAIDEEVRKQLTETLEKFRNLPRSEPWMMGLTEAGHSRWKLMQLVSGNSLGVETHRLLVSQLRFKEDDIPPYVHSLINQHEDDSIPLIEELLLRTDLDFGPYEVTRTLDLLAGRSTNTSKTLPTPPGVDYSAENVKYLWLDAPKPLNEERVAVLARKLLDTFNLTESEGSKEDRESYDDRVKRHPEFLDLTKYKQYDEVYKPFPEYHFEYSRIVHNVAGVLALAYRVSPFDPIPRRYSWCLAQTEPFFGLDLFYSYLKTSQTEDVLRAILNLADGKGRFLARTRAIPGSSVHFQAIRKDNNSTEGKAALEWLS